MKPYLKATAAFLLLVVLGGALVWFVVREPESSSSPLLSGVASGEPGTPIRPMAPARERTRDSAPPPGATVVELSPEGILLLPGSEDLESRLHRQKGGAGEDLEVLTELLTMYSRANNGALPIAPTNEVLISQLKGSNPKGLAVLSANLRNVTEKGELTDRWGTPYFFHPVSGKLIEIRSAGPDRLMWTEDDTEWPPPAVEGPFR